RYQDRRADLVHAAAAAALLSAGTALQRDAGRRRDRRAGGRVLGLGRRRAASVFREDRGGDLDVRCEPQLRDGERGSGDGGVVRWAGAGGCRRDGVCVVRGCGVRWAAWERVVGVHRRGVTLSGGWFGATYGAALFARR